MCFHGYDYKEISVSSGERLSMYLDCYPCFGWERDENFPANGTLLRLKRDRKIANKMELTRLQRHFEACVNEIDALEKSASSAATVTAILTGLAGTAFMAGSVFAVTHIPPLIWLCVLLAIPGFALWTLPCFVHRRVLLRRDTAVRPLIEAKYDEIYEICEKGRALL